MSEKQILEAELIARQQEVAELETTLANLEKELKTLEQLLIQRQEAGPSQEILPETLLETPIIRTPSVADSILSMTYREWKPTFTIEAPKLITEKPLEIPIPIAPLIEAPRVITEKPLEIPIPIAPLIKTPRVIAEEPVVLAEPEPVKEKILSLDWLKDWLKNNWLWVGVGLVGLSLIITIAKD